MDTKYSKKSILIQTAAKFNTQASASKNFENCFVYVFHFESGLTNCVILWF